MKLIRTHLFPPSIFRSSSPGLLKGARVILRDNSGEGERRGSFGRQLVKYTHAVLDLSTGTGK